MGYTKEQRAAKTEKLMSTGIGESKVFRDPDAPQEDTALLECHINGQRIRDLGFTPLQLSALSYHITDEGIAARNEGKSEIHASVTSDPLQKQMQKRKDDVLDRGMETWQASNPMADQIKEHGTPGRRQRYLSDAVVKQQGLRGWQPVIKDGQPVTLGNLKLAEMPEGKARARNAHFREKANDRLAAVQGEYMKSGGGTAVSDQ